MVWWCWGGEDEKDDDSGWIVDWINEDCDVGDGDATVLQDCKEWGGAEAAWALRACRGAVCAENGGGDKQHSATTLWWGLGLWCDAWGWWCQGHEESGEVASMLRFLVMWYDMVMLKMKVKEWLCWWQGWRMHAEEMQNAVQEYAGCQRMLLCGTLVTSHKDAGQCQPQITDADNATTNVSACWQCWWPRTMDQPRTRARMVGGQGTCDSNERWVE